MWFNDKNALVGKRFRTTADTKELLELHGFLAESFASRAEDRAGNAAGHIRRIKQLTGILVRAMLENDYPEFTAEYADNIILASPLHDIGKITVRDEILKKGDKLTSGESGELMNHTLAGSEILHELAEAVGGGTYIAVAAVIARYHHERWNGCGYPDRLRGEAIPLAARIVSITDSFDCLAAGSPYSKKVGVDGAAELLRRFAGEYYDPALTDIFLSKKNAIAELY